MIYPLAVPARCVAWAGPAIAAIPARSAVQPDAQGAAGTDNPLHTHGGELKNVIISGVWYTGADSVSARDFGPGSVVVMPGDWPHVSGCRSGSDCLFYLEGQGKFDFRPSAENPVR